MYTMAATELGIGQAVGPGGHGGLPMDMSLPVQQTAPIDINQFLESTLVSLNTAVI